MKEVKISMRDVMEVSPGRFVKRKAFPQEPCAVGSSAPSPGHTFRRPAIWALALWPSRPGRSSFVIQFPSRRWRWRRRRCSCGGCGGSGRGSGSGWGFSLFIGIAPVWVIRRRLRGIGVVGVIGRRRGIGVVGVIRRRRGVRIVRFLLLLRVRVGVIRGRRGIGVG